MVVPSRQFGNLLIAERTETLLLFPEVEEFPFSFEGVVNAIIIEALPNFWGKQCLFADLINACDILLKRCKESILSF
jgi:hypothetical protein